MNTNQTNNQWLEQNINRIINANVVSSSDMQVSTGSSNHTVYTRSTAGSFSYDENESVQKQIPSPKSLSVGLYFKYVKKGLGKLQEQKLKARLEKLQLIHLNSDAVLQQGLLEATEELLLVTAREQVLLTKGYNKILSRDRIYKYLGIVKNVYMTNLTSFPRPLPKAVQSKLTHVKSLNVFDNFEILYCDYTNTPVTKSTSEKISEKDPILFGTMVGSPDNLYYITDWVDEYCDLTLDKLLVSLKQEGIENDTKNVLDINDAKVLEDLKERVLSRSKAIVSTNALTWRENERAAIRDEEKAKLKKEVKSVPSIVSKLPQKPFWKRLILNTCFAGFIKE